MIIVFTNQHLLKLSEFEPTDGREDHLNSGEPWPFSVSPLYFLAHFLCHLDCE